MSLCDSTAEIKQGLLYPAKKALKIDRFGVSYTAMILR